MYAERTEDLPFAHSYPITEIPVYRNHSWDWVIKNIGTFLFDWKSRYFARQVQQRAQGKAYDVVFVSTFQPMPIRAAVQMAKAQQIPLHIDLRDIDEQTPTHQYQPHKQGHLSWVHRWFRAANIRRRNALIRYANSLSSVSPWHVNLLSHLHPCVHLVYNGYDEQVFYPENRPVDEFRITYTGRIYDRALQNPILFFEALQALRAEGRLPNELRVDWYTDRIGKERVMSWAKQTDTTALMRFHDFTKPDAIPAILQESSIVLVASQKSGPQGPHGIMTTKFFEALGVEKPVLCVPSDEECLAQVIQDTKAGISGFYPLYFTVLPFFLSCV